RDGLVLPRRLDLRRLALRDDRSRPRRFRRTLRSRGHGIARIDALGLDDLERTIRAGLHLVHLHRADVLAPLATLAEPVAARRQLRAGHALDRLGEAPDLSDHG